MIWITVSLLMVAISNELLQGVQALKSEGCGVTRGCYRIPDKCSDLSCEYFLSWAVENDTVAFELQAVVNGSNTPWVGFAINDQRQMSGDSVVDCIVRDGGERIMIQMSHNKGYSNYVLENRYLGLVKDSLSGSYKDGVLYCRFSRYIFVDQSAPESEKVRNLDQSYYLELGTGQTKPDGTKLKHKHNPHISDSKLSFLFYSNLSGSTHRSVLIIAHVILMVIAWMIFISLAVMSSRYMKDHWTMEICGQKLWFQIHRAGVITAVILCISSFIIILYDCNWQFLLPRLHPLLGFLSCCLLVLNPVIALFRPAVDHPRRFIFRWIHGSVGHVCHLLAAVAIYFGTLEPNALLPSWPQWIAVVFIVCTLIVHIMLTLISLFRKGKDGRGSEEQPSSTTGLLSTNTSTSSVDCSRICKLEPLILLIYIIVCVGLSLSLICSVLGPVYE